MMTLFLMYFINDMFFYFWQPKFYMADEYRDAPLCNSLKYIEKKIWNDYILALK